MNLQVHSWNDLWKALFTPQAQGTVRIWSERLFFIVFKSLFGIHPTPFRIWVFLAQIANVFLIAQITCHLTGSRFAALSASILWISNSALIVVMGWNSAYNETLCAFFVLVAFFALLRYIDTSNLWLNRLQWVFYLLGFGALEVNTVYPLLAASYTALCAKQRLPKTLLLFAPAVVFTAIHFVLIPKPSSGPYRLHLDGAVFKTLVTYWTWAVASRQMAILGGTVSRLEPVHDYFASTCCSCRPYCGLALMAFAQPISLAFSTYALAVAASKAITWMPASAWRFASPWL